MNPLYCSLTFQRSFPFIITAVSPNTFFSLLQTVIMYASMMFVIIKGALDLGGFSEVWRVNMESGRAQLIDWDPNPATRHTFWTLVIGGYFTWITIYGVNQAQVSLL